MFDKTKLGLRIDVDTLRGAQQGVPALCCLLAEHKIEASFFFSVGPDNMGRNILRLLNLRFLIKMLRTNAARLYGWEIVLRGLFFPGPLIGKKCEAEIRNTFAAGHEIGLHAWDHQKWQASVKNMDEREIRVCLEKGMNELARVTGKVPVCSAVPAWQCTDKVLEEKCRFPFTYNSDCRGKTIFYPLINGKVISQPQIPVTLPTYDEIIGQGNVSDKNYNEYLLSLISPEKLNVLTIHAEVEGISCRGMFADFIKKAKQKNILIVPLGHLLKESSALRQSHVIKGRAKGRQGWLCRQSESRNDD